MTFREPIPGNLPSFQEWFRETIFSNFGFPKSQFGSPQKQVFWTPEKGYTPKRPAFFNFFFSFFFPQNGRLFAFFFLFTFVFPKRPAFKQKKFFHKAKKKQTKNISGLEFLLDPELRGRSTGSMVRDFVLGITFSPKILVKLRRPFGTPPSGPPPPFHSNFIRKCYPRKNS